MTRSFTIQKLFIFSCKIFFLRLSSSKVHQDKFNKQVLSYSSYKALRNTQSLISYKHTNLKSIVIKKQSNKTS